MIRVIEAMQRAGGDHRATAADIIAAAPDGVLPNDVEQATMVP